MRRSSDASIEAALDMLMMLTLILTQMMRVMICFMSTAPGGNTYETIKKLLEEEYNKILQYLEYYEDRIII
jgi:hypothetical protein